MTVREAPPTYRELITYDESRKRWVFDPQWLQWFLRQTAALGAAITDHGGLTGLADDDHPQYHNDARGDARYQPLDSDLTAIAALVTASFGRSLLTLVDGPALAATHTHTGAVVLAATLAADESTAADTNPISLTDLAWDFEANSVYSFRFIGNVSPATATTGCGFQLLVT